MSNCKITAARNNVSTELFKLKTIFTILSLTAITISIFLVRKEKKDQIHDSSKKSDVSEQHVSATEFVAELERLGYFKYADKNHRDSLKENLITYFDPDNELVTLWDDHWVPLDYRYYTCDGEAVFEQGGFTEMLEEVLPTLEKTGLTIEVTDHFEQWDSENNWLNHRITINGTEYIIFKNFRDYGWGEAVMRFAQILNQEAEKQSVDERVYLVSGGNDGRLIFLTDELYRYIYRVYKNKQWKPLEVSEWMTEMGVKPMKLD